MLYHQCCPSNILRRSRMCGVDMYMCVRFSSIRFWTSLYGFDFISPSLYFLMHSDFHATRFNIALAKTIREFTNTNHFSKLMIRSYINILHDIKSSAAHDDVIKWKYFPRYWPFVRGIHRSPVNSLHKGQRRGALVFTLIYAWINGWVNNREAGDWRRYRANHDVIVIYLSIWTEIRDVCCRYVGENCLYWNWTELYICRDQTLYYYSYQMCHHSNSSIVISRYPSKKTFDSDPLVLKTWWRHQMETFSASLALCEGNPPVIGGLSSQRPVTRSFDVVFDLCLNKRLKKQSRRRWSETPSRSLWRLRNDRWFFFNIIWHTMKICFMNTVRSKWQ